MNDTITANTQQTEEPAVAAHRALRVLIGTPSHDGRLESWYTHCLIETIKLGLQHGVLIDPIFMCYDSLLPRARNDLVKMALDNGHDYLLFIDADQTWNPMMVLSCLGKQVDAVGLPCVKKSDTEQYNIKAEVPLIADPTTGLIEVISVGTGWLLLSRRALIAIYEVSTPYTNEGRENRMMFEITVQDGQLISEDTTFCKKLRDLGIKIWIDPSSTCGHVGTKLWNGDFTNWYARLRAAELQANVLAGATADPLGTVAATQAKGVVWEPTMRS